MAANEFVGDGLSGMRLTNKLELKCCLTKKSASNALWRCCLCLKAHAKPKLKAKAQVQFLLMYSARMTLVLGKTSAVKQVASVTCLVAG